MARRRQSAGSSVGLGIGAGLSSIGQQLQGIAEKRMENDLIMERQAALSKQNDLEAQNRAKETQKTQLLEKALSDPTFARRLQQSGLAEVLGMDIPEPTSEDILGPMGASLSEADDPSKVDTPEGMINQLRSQGGIISDTPVKGQTQVPPMGIAQLLAARKAKETKFTESAAAEPVRGKRMRPTGIEEEYFSTAGDVAGQAYPTERTTSQEAGRQGSVAGAQAGASTNATERALHTPANIAGAASRAGAIAEAQAGAKGGGSGLTPSMQAGVNRLKSSLSILKELDPSLTSRTGVGGRLAGFAQQWGARVTGEDSSAVVYDAISAALLPALARSSGEVGNLAEQEQIRYERLAPKVSNPINIRVAKYAAIQYIIDAAAKGSSADEMRPFLDYLQFAQGGGQGAALRDRFRQEARGQ